MAVCEVMMLMCPRYAGMLKRNAQVYAKEVGTWKICKIRP